VSGGTTFEVGGPGSGGLKDEVGMHWGLLSIGFTGVILDLEAMPYIGRMQRMYELDPLPACVKALRL